jgi:hypothetical protein
MCSFFFSLSSYTPSNAVTDAIMRHLMTSENLDPSLLQVVDGDMEACTLLTFS